MDSQKHGGIEVPTKIKIEQKEILIGELSYNLDCF